MKARSHIGYFNLQECGTTGQTICTSMVFAASPDTVLQRRRSAEGGSIRLFKPTKLRHGDDARRAVRLLSLDTSSLWFDDQGIVDEVDHVATDRAGDVAKKVDVDWPTAFGGDKVLKRKVILNRLPNTPSRSVDRALSDAVKDNSPLVKGTKEGECSFGVDQKEGSTEDSLPSSECILGNWRRQPFGDLL